MTALAFSERSPAGNACCKKQQRPACLVAVHIARLRFADQLATDESDAHAAWIEIGAFGGEMAVRAPGSSGLPAKKLCELFRGADERTLRGLHG